ncbi:MAG: hypothetical protein IPG46_01140 [Actinobacteria bacterium]|nr:hypothetical protein [Actinomycetota bacterium]
MSQISRRTLLAGGAAAGLAALTSCGDETSSTGTVTTTTPTATSLIAVFPQGEQYLAAGRPQRMPFILADADGAPLDSIAGSATFTVSRKGTPVGEPITVPGRSEGLMRGYLALPFETDQDGVYDIVATYEGRQLDASVQFWPADKVKYPQIGDPLPSIATPTVDDHRGVDPICTADPPCPLHTKNLAEVLGMGSPVAVLVSTPAYCQTAICGPVLGLVQAAAPKFPGITFIHAEVYANPAKVASIDEATPAPIVDAFSMPFEPALFIADGSGALLARLDSIFDANELADTLKKVGA